MMKFSEISRKFEQGISVWRTSWGSRALIRLSFDNGITAPIIVADGYALPYAFSADDAIADNWATFSDEHIPIFTAVGKDLDEFGGEKLKRNPGETDNDYRGRVLDFVFKSYWIPLDYVLQTKI